MNATEDKVSNGHAIKPAENAAETTSAVQDTSGGETSSATSTPEKKPKKRDTSTERGTVKVMAMEVTAQRENGKRLSRPSTPLLPMSGHSDTVRNITWFVFATRDKIKQSLFSNYGRQTHRQKNRRQDRSFSMAGYRTIQRFWCRMLKQRWKKWNRKTPRKRTMHR